MSRFFSKNVSDVLNELNTTANGLSSAESESRLAKYGKNELAEGHKKSLLRKFFDQLKDVMIIVLIVAAVVSAVVAIVEKQYADLVDSGIIMLIVIINAIIGLTQESKAEAALDSLKNLNKPFVKVMRDGNLCKIKSEELVAGDIVTLEAGDIVPADIRIIESASLKIEEAALTGESVPSDKDIETIANEEAPLGDRKCMAYSSGLVAYGRGRGVVVETGMNTEVGKIAKMLGEESSGQTPLQVQLAKTAKILSIIVLFIAVIIFGASLLFRAPGVELKHAIIDSFMTAVAIAVAAIPEGLPAVVTIVLAIGVQKMSEKRAIVRNLPAVETLGCCEVICSDKTGTLTLNQMTVKELFTVSTGNYLSEGIDKFVYSQVMLNKGMTLCNDTSVGEAGKLLGDPTETALVAYCKIIGLDSVDLNKVSPRINEIPFDSVRKLMTTVHNMDGKDVSFTKGAPDILISKCSHILDNDKIRPITDADFERIKDANKEMAVSALRVLAVAMKNNELQVDKLEENLIFIGLVGMIDPPRVEVKEAVKVCKKAGMTAVMITGDHIDTARAIAKQIGILSEEGELVITGAELDKISEEDFIANIEKYRVFARVSPENKVRIVKAFKAKKKVVAMTGDGVNDAPSIKCADIGIGMGITGTDVSKGASDMVLADDNFATIISAVEEGRKVFSNIKKAVQFLLSANIAEVLCLFIATIFLRVPFLTPVMILWVNLVTDSLPALALGVEKVEKDIMNHPPRKAGSSLFKGKTGLDIIIQGTMQTILVLGAFAIGEYAMNLPQVGVTMAFLTLCLIQLFHAYNLKSQERSLFSSNPFDNKFLNLSFLIGLVLILVVIMFPFTRAIFGTTALNFSQLAISFAFGIAIIPFVEIQKIIEGIVEKKKISRKNS